MSLFWHMIMKLIEMTGHSGCIVRKYINWIRLNSGKSYIPIGLFVLPDNGGQNGNGRIFSLQEDAGILRSIISHPYLNHAFFTTVCLCIFVMLLSDMWLCHVFLYVTGREDRGTSDLFGIKLFSFVIFIINIVTLPAINTINRQR